MHTAFSTARVASAPQPPARRGWRVAGEGPRADCHHKIPCALAAFP